MSAGQVYAVFGDDDFQRHETRRIIDDIAARHHGSPENTDVFPPDKHDLGRITESLKTFSLFGTPKFFVLQNCVFFKAVDTADSLYLKLAASREEGDDEGAYRHLISLIETIGLSSDEYEELRRSPSLLRTYLEGIAGSFDLVEELVRKFGLPDRLADKKSGSDIGMILKEIPSGHFLIITAADWDRRTRNFKALDGIARIIEKPKNQNTLREQRKLRDERCLEYMQQCGKSLAPADAHLLRNVAGDCSSLSSSLTKLDLLSAGAESLSRVNIFDAFDDDVLPNMQNLPDLIRKKDVAEIMRLIADRGNTKTEFIKLTGYFKSMLRNAIALAEIAGDEVFPDFGAFERRFIGRHGEALSRTALRTQHPYYLFQCHLTFCGFGTDKLTDLYERLFDVEKDLKTTQQPPCDGYVDFFRLMFSPKS